MPARLEARPNAGKAIGFLVIQSNELGNQPMTFGQIALAAPARAWYMATATLSGIAQRPGRQPIRRHAGGCSLSRRSRGRRCQPAARANGHPLDQTRADELAPYSGPGLRPVSVLPGGVRGQPAQDRVQDLAIRTDVAAIDGLFELSTLHDHAGFGFFPWLANLKKSGVLNVRAPGGGGSIGVCFCRILKTIRPRAS